MTSHAWGVLKSGPITVTINVGAACAAKRVPRPERPGPEERAHHSPRTSLGILRGRPGDPDLVPVEPSEDCRRGKLASLQAKSAEVDMTGGFYAMRMA